MIKTADTSGKILFEEQQHFPQWLMFLMIVPLLVSIAAFAATGILSTGEKYLWLVFVFVILLQLVIIYYFKVASFEKIVTETGLYFRWSPIHKRYRFIPRTDMEGFRMRRGPLLKYGSGYRIGIGRYHNLSTGMGVQLFLSNGKKIFFGSDEKIFFQRAMNQIAQPIGPLLPDN